VDLGARLRFHGLRPTAPHGTSDGFGTGPQATREGTGRSCRGRRRLSGRCGSPGPSRGRSVVERADPVTATPPPPAPPPGWYPVGDHQVRYWDGRAWTDQVTHRRREPEPVPRAARASDQDRGDAAPDKDLDGGRGDELAGAGSGPTRRPTTPVTAPGVAELKKRYDAALAAVTRKLRHPGSSDRRAMSAARERAASDRRRPTGGRPLEDPSEYNGAGRLPSAPAG
jgi:hypothetical protein